MVAKAPICLRQGRRSGFTLIEVLVVLGILVILFALLFVPMTSSLSMVSSGRTQADMQQRLRLTMEQLQRDLSEATYVYPPEVIRIPSATPQQNGFLVNYSTLSMILPAKDSSGQPLEPLQADWQSVPGGTKMQLVTRYAVHTATTITRKWAAGSPGNPGGNDKYFQVSTSPGPENAFQLYRQQGFMRWDDDLQTYTFGSWTDLNADGVVSANEFQIDRPLAENSQTARIGSDVVVSKTVCRDNGQAVDGYVPVDDAAVPPVDPALGAGWTAQVVYLFDNMNFQPLRVAEEQMAMSADGSVYRASRGGWLGLLNDGTKRIVDLVWGAPLQWINSSELRPRIFVRRWTGAGSGYLLTEMDTDALDPNSAQPDADTNNLLTLRWNSQTGTVLVGDVMPVPDQINNNPGVMFGTASGDPGAAFWPLAAGQPRADLLPEWPVTPNSAMDARAPVGYVIDPWQVEGINQPWNPYRSQGQASARDVKVMPETIRIWLVWREAGKSQTTRKEFSLSSSVDPQQLGAYQFLATPFDDGKRVEIKFNPGLPAGPDLIASQLAAGTGMTLDICQIQVTYQARRNFDPATGNDDQIMVSYSSASLYSVALGLSEYSPYEIFDTTKPYLRPFKTGAQALLSARVATANMGR
ncbi:MAG TPA: type II secretion system protein [Armatimonadota bacterium]|jgi:prepilin-type N-terminal cleavage/methylation domain-containing protein